MAPPILRRVTLSVASPAAQRLAWQALGFHVERAAVSATAAATATADSSTEHHVIRFGNLDVFLQHRPVATPQAGGGAVRREATREEVEEEVAEEASSVAGWAWEGLPLAAAPTGHLAQIPVHSLDGGENRGGRGSGRRTSGSNSISAAGGPGGARHPNRVATVDHVVLRTSDCARLAADLELAGLRAALVRDDIYPGVTQMFFKTGPHAAGSARGAVLEVVGPSAAAPEDNDATAATAGGAGARGGFLGVNATGQPQQQHRRRQEKEEEEQEQELEPYTVSLWGLALESADIEATAAAATPQCSKVRKAVQPGRRILTLKPEQPLGLALAVLSRVDGRPPAAAPKGDARADADADADAAAAKARGSAL